MTLAGQLTQEADRALRKARLLASGGFPEDAPLLLLKAVQKAATACLVGRGELQPGSWAAAETAGYTIANGATAAGAPSASDADIRRLAADSALPEVLEILDVTQASAGPTEPGRIGAMIEKAERFVAAVGAATTDGQAANAAANGTGSGAAWSRQAA
jgi:hypothetical protein